MIDGPGYGLLDHAIGRGIREHKKLFKQNDFVRHLVSL